MLKAAVSAALMVVLLLLACITNPGIAPDTGAGRGTIVVQEKNGLHAAIYLDYRPTGRTTPDTMENIPAGSHTIGLFYKDYSIVSGPAGVEVREDRIAEANFEMQKSPSGALQVSSEPAGAMASLNGIDFGGTPLLLEGLPAGTYTVGARLGNLRSPDAIVEVTQSARAQIDLLLHPVTSVVIEYFSNTDCAGCPAASAAIEQVIEAMPQYKDQICKMAIHADWPSAGDPFYVAARDDCKARIGLYNIANDPDGLPIVYVNGEKIAWPPDNAAAFIAQAERRIDSTIKKAPAALLSFDAISVDTVVKDSLLRVTGSLSVRDSGPGHKLFIALIEDFIGYSTPPGGNGQRLFDAVFRGFSKEADGIPPPQSGSALFSMDIRLPLKPPFQFSLIAFLQSATTREIVQAQRLRLY